MAHGALGRRAPAIGLVAQGMSGWIPIDKDMADDPRLTEAATVLAQQYILARHDGEGTGDLTNGDGMRFARNALLGGLVTLWIYADTHLRNDDTLPLTSQTLDALVGIEGFFDLMPRDWVVELDDGAIKLPGYCEKNRLIAKRKAAENNKARQARWRAAHNAKRNGVHAEHNSSVTGYVAVTKSVDLDLDQDLSEKRNPPTEGKEKRAARAPTAQRLPDDFELTEERKATAIAEAVNPEREFARFCDHWRASAGPNARKRDWDAAWRNWCRKAAEFKPQVSGSEDTGWRPTQ